MTTQFGPIDLPTFEHLVASEFDDIAVNARWKRVFVIALLAYHPAGWYGVQLVTRLGHLLFASTALSTVAVTFQMYYVLWLYLSFDPCETYILAG